MKPLYLDDAASTPVERRVLGAMMPYFSEQYGNASSSHAKGEEALQALTQARVQLARTIGAKTHEILFTSGTSESDSWVFHGLARAYPEKKTVVISAIEHSTVMESCAYLEKSGYRIIKLPVDREGFVDLAYLKNILQKHHDVLVVSICHGNNVIGTVQDIAAIGKLCRSQGVFFHSDAAQTFAKMRIDVRAMHIDLLSASAHKIGGPKGIGLLYVRDGVRIAPLIFGGGQERGLRGGTENIPGAVGFAVASNLKYDENKIMHSRDRLIRELEKIGGVINGPREQRLAGNVHVSFPANARLLVAYLSRRGIYVATGSACDSKREKEDHVLAALGLLTDAMEGSLRISFSRYLTATETRHLIHEISNGLKKFSSR